jgi:hypothetical protein
VCGNVAKLGCRKANKPAALRSDLDWGVVDINETGFPQIIDAYVEH